MQELTKICNACGEEKPLSGFDKNKQCKLGVTGTCSACRSARVAWWYAANRKRRQDAANKRNRERKQLVVDRFGGACMDCGGVFHQCVYEFHHLDPSQKDWNPSQSLTHSLERMWEELSKCVMLCSNCHKIRHWGDQE